MRHISDAERRSRLSVRHSVAHFARASDPVAATRAMTVLHGTEPATVHLSLHARVEDLGVDDIERALYDDRTLVKQLAMRRTLFVFPRDLLPAALGSASARVAGPHGVRLAKDVEKGGLATDGEAWLKQAREAVLARLADGSALTAQQLREQVPELEGRVDMAPGTKWGGSVPMAPRVLTQLGLEGEIVRGRNTGHWRTSRPEWTLMRTWLGEDPARLSSGEGYVELVRRWLATFGPGTTTDIQWWLGATVGAVRKALTALEAAEVSLDGDATGWVLPDDVDPPEHQQEHEQEPWAALLPVLDPTVMGWKERRFYLGPHAADLFDSNGNAGTTAWWGGRVVGCWVQDEHGTVEVRLLEKVPAAATRALAAEAERLTAWLGGVRVGTVYPSPAMRASR